MSTVDDARATIQACLTNPDPQTKSEQRNQERVRRMATILARRFTGPRETRAAIARDLGISESRVQQIEDKSLRIISRRRRDGVRADAMSALPPRLVAALDALDAERAWMHAARGDE